MALWTLSTHECPGSRRGSWPVRSLVRKARRCIPSPKWTFSVMMLTGWLSPNDWSDRKSSLNISLQQRASSSSLPTSTGAAGEKRQYFKLLDKTVENPLNSLFWNHNSHEAVFGEGGMTISLSTVKRCRVSCHLKLSLTHIKCLFFSLAITFLPSYVSR